MVSDPIADFLVQIKNGYLARLQDISVPHSRVKEALSRILLRCGYLGDVQADGEGKKMLHLKLKYVQRTPVLTDLERVSKPGRRIYVTRRNVPNVVGGLGVAIISTPRGFMTDNEARKEKVGGEVICKIW